MSPPLSDCYDRLESVDETGFAQYSPPIRVRYPSTFITKQKEYSSSHESVSIFAILTLCTAYNVVKFYLPKPM
jgi:hypothetical protein